MRQINGSPNRPQERLFGPCVSEALSWLPAALLAAVLAVGSFVPGARSAQFSEALVFFELNDTDGDLGIHALIDGEPWTDLAIDDGANNSVILHVQGQGNLGGEIGLTEIFFESVEPPFDELDPEDFFDLFPEGMYEISAETLEGGMLKSKTRVTHTMPAPPVAMVNGLPAAENCDADLPVVSDPVIISWEPVTASHPDLGNSGVSITVVNYEVVVEVEGTRFRNAVILPPEATSVEVPAEILELSDEIKFEILVREKSFNQAAMESCFEVE